MAKYDQLTIDRIDLMHPAVRQNCLKDYKDCSDILPEYHMLRYTDTLRNWEKQAEIYAQGRTKLYDAQGNRLGIVSYAPPGFSMHNYGLAYDYVILVDKDRNGTYEEADWNNVNNSKVVGFLKGRGWFWGGDWKGKKKDPPHFQRNVGFDIEQLRLKYRNNDFITGTKYVTL
jgi:peptidoglycan LD-endopeptidase CwlK